MSAVIMGFEGTLTVNNVDPGFRNLRFGMGHTEVDATTNKEQGNKAYVKGLYDKYIGAEFKLDDSAACQTILTAITERTAVPVTASLGEGITISGNMFVFGGELSTSLDDAVWMSITCRPAPTFAAAGGGT